ncbi:hypothetical protein RVBP17_0300 [Pseudomonas phage sp. 30-3]|nr:hypothetical protein RVBP16_3670 [Pseudomonas phage sp. 30-2]BDR25987.1 hypothetical protein RVBP17_0300 [Pseudomonas phage sp. 30-3]
MNIIERIQDYNSVFDRISVLYLLQLISGPEKLNNFDFINIKIVTYKTSVTSKPSATLEYRTCSFPIKIGLV